MLDSKKAGLFVFVLACAIRLAALSLWSVNDVTHADQSEYLALAQNIHLHGTLSFGAPHKWGSDGVLNGSGPFLPTATRAPLYPLMVAALWLGGPPPILTVYLVQVLLGGLVALLVYSIALKAFDRKVALLSGIAMAFAPMSSYFIAVVLSETLFTFLLTAGLWLWGRQHGFLAGILFGAATLTRPIALLLVFVIGIAALAIKFNRTIHARLVFGAILIVAPWTVRNAVTQHAFIPVQTYGWGCSPFFGTIDVPYGTGSPWHVWLKDETLTNIVATSRTVEEAETRFSQAARERIARAPLQWLWIRLKQYPRLFLDPGTYVMPLIPLPAMVVKGTFVTASFLFAMFSIVGLYMARKQWRHVYHLALVPLVFGIAQFPGQTEVRYSLPLVPVLTVFAAFAISRFTAGRKTSWPVWRRSKPSLSAPS